MRRHARGTRVVEVSTSQTQTRVRCIAQVQIKNIAWLALSRARLGHSIAGVDIARPGLAGL